MITEVAAATASSVLTTEAAKSGGSAIGKFFGNFLSRFENPEKSRLDLETTRIAHLKAAIEIKKANVEVSKAEVEAFKANRECGRDLHQENVFLRSQLAQQDSGVGTKGPKSEPICQSGETKVSDSPQRVIHELSPCMQTLGTATLVGGLALGGVWTTWRITRYFLDKRTASGDAMALGQLRKGECGALKDLSEFARKTDEALLRNPAAYDEEMKLNYAKCFKKA